MDKRLFKRFVLLIMMFFVKLTVAQAALSVSVNGDFVTLTPGTSATGYWYGTTSDFGSATNITKVGGVRTTSKGTLSLKNGTYYFHYMTASNARIPAGPIKITSSCSNKQALNQTGPFTVERCYVITSGSTKALPEVSGTVATCANGYVQDDAAAGVKSNGCKGLSLNGLGKRYCKVVFTGKCVKSNNSGGGSSGGGGNSGGGGKTIPAASVSSLSISGGSLSPAFKSGTKSYKASVSAGTSSVNVNATASGGSFVSGYGPRTVKLNYGNNKVQVKVKNSAGKVTVYTIVVNRADNRSTVNTLSNLTVSSGTLTPAFSSGQTNYSVSVPNEVTNITIGATLTDSKSSFVSGTGPGNYALNLGNNQLYVKVKSERGSVNTYSIKVIRETEPSKCATESETLALLKGINLSVDISNVEIEPIKDFESTAFTYDVKVPYKVANLIVQPYVNTDGDTTTVEGAEDLEVNVVKQVKITVKSKECPSYSNVYTLNVTRQPEQVKSSNPELANITIEGHKEFEFEANQETYPLTIKSSEKEVKIKTEPVDENTTCTITGNEDLKYGSKIEIKCLSEDESATATYVINVDKVIKGTNAFLVILVVIIIILILVYLVLRLLGYKIYFNFAVIGAFFRGIGEKIKNIFDR